MKRRWLRPRFTLAVLLIVITVAAIPLGYIAQRRAWNLRRKRAVEALIAKGVRLSPERYIGDQLVLPQLANYTAVAKWWRSVLADDQSSEIRTVEYFSVGSQNSKLAPLTDSDLALLNRFPEIENVKLDSAEQVTDFGLASVASLPRLQDLQLHYLPLPKGLFLGSFHAKSPIKKLQFTKLDALDGANLIPIGQLPALERFWIDRCTKLDDESLMHVTMPLTVTDLFINVCPIGDQTILRWLVNHRYQHLSICGKMTRITVNTLSQQTAVKQLYLKNAPFIDEDFAFLTNWKELEVLHLEAMPVSGDFLDSIGAPDRLIYINLPSTLFEDANFAKLKRFKKLSILDLSWTPISGEGLAHLGPLPEHSQLRFIGARFTDKGMDALTHLPLNTPPGKVPLLVDLPSNWTAEDFRRFDGGKPPWPVHADIFTALERKRETGEDTSYYWSGFSSRRVASPLDNVPAHLMQPVLALHEHAREKSHQEEDAATKAYHEVNSK